MRPRARCVSASVTSRVLAVKAGGWLVQDQDGRITDGRTGDRDALSLSTGQSYATFAQHGVVTVGQRLYELVGVGQSCRGLDLLRRRVGRAVPMFSRTVAANRSVSWRTTPIWDRKDSRV